jgi:predicted glycoside hydrolase/deacetylase ChbG (UPF0249 family)
MIAIFCSADDYGRSKSAVDYTNLCIEKGLIQNVSLICGGDDWKRAIEFLRKIHNIDIAVHLSLFSDSAPLADKSLIPNLISKGRLRFNLVKLWLALNISPKRKQIKEQIFIEFCAQIDFFLSSFPQKTSIKIDGHQHIHAMPALLSVMERLIKKYKVSFIRTPIEPNLKFKASFLKRIKGNMRRFLLKRWGLSLKKLLQKHGVQTSDYFIGAALSCELTYDYLSQSLKNLSDKNGICEIMLHPGYNELETNMILSKEFEQLISRFNKS